MAAVIAVSKYLSQCAETGNVSAEIAQPRFKADVIHFKTVREPAKVFGRKHVLGSTADYYLFRRKQGYEQLFQRMPAHRL